MSHLQLPSPSSRLQGTGPSPRNSVFSAPCLHLRPAGRNKKGDTQRRDNPAKPVETEQQAARTGGGRTAKKGTTATQNRLRRSNSITTGQSRRGTREERGQSYTPGGAIHRPGRCGWGAAHPRPGGSVVGRGPSRKFFFIFFIYFFFSVYIFFSEFKHFSNLNIF
jgi:hypothetical protein